MNERQTLFSAQEGAPASGMTTSRMERGLEAEVLRQLPVAVLLVDPSGVVAFANEAAQRDIDRPNIVDTKVECVLAPLDHLLSMAREKSDVGYSISEVERGGEANLYAVIVHDVSRAVRLLEERNERCDGSNANGICGLCWEQNLLELVGYGSPNPEKEAVAFSKVVVEQVDVASNEEVAPIPPPPTWHADDRDFDQLVDDGAEALLTKEYGVALQAYERAARMRPDASMIQGNLERLRELVEPPAVTRD